ncbi:MAG TPA: N-acetylglucosamine-6-phosphate deacetylase [Planctomycetota bacterium]|nr:N-acetylglucosamine-6-phosphate deacetylase [Planctomycetota bacterium]
MAKTKTLLFVNGTVILPDRMLKNAAVLCRGGRIASVGPRRGLKVPDGATVIDAQGGFIGPGYIDIHVHGGDNADFMDGTPDAVRTVLRAHARHGTTTLFPTTTTGSPQQISAMLRACRDVQKKWNAADGAQIAGVHFYGPYFAEKKTGCHARKGRRDPDPREYLKSFDLNIIKVATCAAELSGAEKFYTEASRRGCLVTCGHSDSSWPEMQRAFDAGMRHVDHFWCAMSSISSVRARFGFPMHGSMAEFVLMNPEMSTEVIADGCHLAPELLEFALRMKGEKRVLLVTDANRALDMPPGKYRFGPQTDGEWFESDGKVGFKPNEGLASSVVGMDTMVRNMARMTSAGVAKAVRMGSLTPAERTGIAKETGSIEPGKRADILLLDRELNVKSVYLAGEKFSGETHG